MRVRPDTPGPVADLGQPLVGGTAMVLDAKMRGDHRHTRMRHGTFELIAQASPDGQPLRALTAEQREGAMRRDRAYRFGIVVVVPEFFSFGGFFPLGHFGEN